MADHQPHDRQHTPESGSGRAYWDGRYRERERVWSGAANAVLVREARTRPPAGPWTWAAARAATRSGWPGAAGG